jgi:hypothetical protein
MNLIDIIYNAYKTLFQWGNYSTAPGEKLYQTAVLCAGKDMAPMEWEFGCAEAVNEVVYKAFGDYAGGDLSTRRMYLSIINNKKFMQVKIPLRGDIYISPTGWGNGKLKNGHVGILANNEHILSNDSQSGLFVDNFTIQSWNERYVKIGGFPVFIFRRISF